MFYFIIMQWESPVQQNIEPIHATSTIHLLTVRTHLIRKQVYEYAVRGLRIGGRGTNASTFSYIQLYSTAGSLTITPSAHPHPFTHPVCRRQRCNVLRSRSRSNQGGGDLACLTADTSILQKTWNLLKLPVFPVMSSMSVLCNNGACACV